MSTQPPQPPSAESGALRGGYEPEWLDDGTPYSPEHGDVYYTRGEGLAESAYVFLEQNALAERWAALHEAPGPLREIQLLAEPFLPKELVADRVARFCGMARIGVGDALHACLRLLDR